MTNLKTVIMQIQNRRNCIDVTYTLTVMKLINILLLMLHVACY